MNKEMRKCIGQYQESQTPELGSSEEKKRLTEKAEKVRARKAYKVYADDEKTIFLYYLKFKMYKSAAAGRMASITVKFGTS